MDVRNHGEKDPIDCAEKGDIEYFENVSKDVILRARNPKGYTVLDRAVMEGSLECCEVICMRFPELVYHQNTTDLTTALTHAAYKGDTDKILLLLHTAQRVYDHDMLEDLLRKKDLRKATPLHWAVDQKKKDAAGFLMSADCDGGLEYGPNQEGDTPLLLAIRNNDDRVSVEIRRLILEMLPTQCLIRSGEKNWTVLHLTASKGNIDVVEDIILYCPDYYADLRDTDNRNFLHLAAQFGRTELVKHVLENEFIGPSVLNAVDNYGNTPFHIAALSGNRIMTEVFLYSPKVHKYTVNAKGQKVLDAVTFYYDKARAQVYVRDRVDEKELKEQSDFDLVVGALIAAVSFTAGITVPGGI